MSYLSAHRNVAAAEYYISIICNLGIPTGHSFPVMMLDHDASYLSSIPESVHLMLRQLSDSRYNRNIIKC